MADRIARAEQASKRTISTTRTTANSTEDARPAGEWSTPNRVLNPTDTSGLNDKAQVPSKHWHDKPVYRFRFRTEPQYVEFSTLLKKATKGVGRKGKIAFFSKSKRVEIRYFPRLARSFCTDAILEHLHKNPPETETGKRPVTSYRNPYLVLDSYLVKDYEQQHNQGLRDEAKRWDERKLAVVEKRSFAGAVNSNFRASREEFLAAVQTLCRGSFYLGEDHADDNPHRFLIDNMAHWKSMGVDTIFREGIFHELQGEIDAYLKQQGDALPKELKILLKENEVALLRHAKREGVRVVGVDTQRTYSTSEDAFDDPFEYAALRTKAMNEATAQIIDREKGKGFYILTGGASHLLRSSVDGIPGIGALHPDCPVLMIRDMHEMPENEGDWFGILSGKDYNSGRDGHADGVVMEYATRNIYTQVSLRNRPMLDLFIDAPRAANLKLA